MSMVISDFYYEATTDILYYDKEKNVMMDSDGFIVYDVFRIITPNQLYLFKQKKQSMLVTGKNGLDVELVYPDADYISYFPVTHWLDIH